VVRLGKAGNNLTLRFGRWQSRGYFFFVSEITTTSIDTIKAEKLIATINASYVVINVHLLSFEE